MKVRTRIQQISTLLVYKINRASFPIDNIYLTQKSQLHDVITNDNGTPDYLAINIYYDTLRSWHVPNKMKKQDGTIVHISKLKTKGIYFSYKKLSELHGCSTETIRRKLVKLENLGLIKRGFKHRETATTKSYNQLIIYVWRHTPHFFNKHGVDQSEVGEFNPQTNHEYITEKYNIDYYSQIEQIKAIEGRGGIHTGVDTKELIEPFNKLKDRSNESNFYKNNFNLNSKFQNLKPDNNKIEDLAKVDADEAENTSCTTNSTEVSKENKIALGITNNGFLGRGKTLKDLLEHLTDEMCSTLRSKSGRDFTDKAIREIAKVVSRSKKGSRAFFYHIKGLIAYLSKILRFEKRDPVKISSVNYYITANQTTEERDIQKQEKYLSEIEYSLQASSEWHLKKKLAAVLERSKAYNVLTSFKSLDIREGKALMNLNKHVELSDNDKEIILSQIQATHEKTEEEGIYQYIDFLEVEMPDKSISESISTPSLTFEQKLDFLKREGLWGRIRETFAKSFTSGGDNLDKAWLSKFKAKIDEEQKTIELYASTRFVKDWVESNYLRYIEDAARKHGLFLQNLQYKI